MKKTLLMLLFIFVAQSWAQQHISRNISELEKDFRAFKYQQVLEKGNFLLSDPYVTKNDSLTILKYMLSAAYSLADTVAAKKIIRQIIKCDPQFSLNPIETSPKIIEFFEHVKKQIREHKPLIVIPKKQTVIKEPVTLPTRAIIFSTLLPGAGHLHQKLKKRGWWFSGLSAGILSGALYATIETSKRQDAYLTAKPGDDFDRLYDRYNSAYKIRNALWAVFAIWDLYVLYDLQKQWRLSINPQNNTLNLSLSW